MSIDWKRSGNNVLKGILLGRVRNGLAKLGLEKWLSRRPARLALSFSIAGLFILVGYQNCDNTRLALVKQASIENIKTNGEICAGTPSTYENYTKVMFVVDKSGSNSTTDTNKYRVNTISSFYQKHQENAFVQWGLVVFNGNTSEAYINSGSPQQPTFSADVGTVTTAITKIGTAADAGATPYKSALAMARSGINYDLTMNPGQASTYVVVFLSDGQPTDYGAPADETAIMSDVDSLVKMGRVTLSTVYYGPADAVASGRLSKMAQAGAGRFLDTNIDGRIPIDHLIGFATSEPWMIKNFYVTNLNANPCDDGSIDADSDADGLCDKDELRYNSEYKEDPTKSQRMAGMQFDPYNRNSFSATLSDAFYYKYIVYGEALPLGCTDTADSDSDLLNNCEEQFLKSTTPTGATQKWTEAMGQDADPFNFDSDGDGFTDFFEFMMTRNKSSAVDFNNLAQQYLGIRLDTILIEHRNWRNPTNAIPYDGKLRFARVNAEGQNCYSYQQTILPLYRSAAVSTAKSSGNSNLAHAANENVILISFIQSPEKDPNGPGELRFHFQKVSASVNQVNLNLRVDQYQSYKVSNDARVEP